MRVGQVSCSVSRKFFAEAFEDENLNGPPDQLVPSVSEQPLCLRVDEDDLALVIGDGDRTYLGANDYMEKKLPHAERTTVEGARHYVMRSHPDDVAAAVRSMTTAVRG